MYICRLISQTVFVVFTLLTYFIPHTCRYVCMRANVCLLRRICWATVFWRAEWSNSQSQQLQRLHKHALVCAPTHTHALNIFVLKSASSVFFSLQVTLLGPVVILASPPMVPGNRQISRSVPRFISAAQRALIWLVPLKGCASPMELGLEHSLSVNVGTYFYWAFENLTQSHIHLAFEHLRPWKKKCSHFIPFLPSCPVRQPRHSKQWKSIPFGWNDVFSLGCLLLHGWLPAQWRHHQAVSSQWDLVRSTAQLYQ